MDLEREALDTDTLAGIDTVFHLAARAHALTELEEDEAAYRRMNVEGTRSLLRVAERSEVKRFVFFSSVKTIGEGGEQCVDETWDLKPESVYGRTKQEAERLILEAGARSSMHVCILRLPLVYGPGVKGNFLRMMQAIDRGRFPPLPETANKRSLVHVDDVVQAALSAAENPRANGQTYIVTDGRTYSTREIYVLISRAVGRDVPGWSLPVSTLRAAARAADWFGRVRGRRFAFDSDALQKLLGSAWYSSDKISRNLGYRPRWTLADSVAEMVAVYRKQRGREP